MADTGEPDIDETKLEIGRSERALGAAEPRLENALGAAESGTASFACADCIMLLVDTKWPVFIREGGREKEINRVVKNESEKERK